MNEQLTEIALIVDESGSMFDKMAATTAGYDSFILEQSQLEGDANLSVVLFNHKHRTVVERTNLKAVVGQSLEYRPNGMTALYDALGHTILWLGEVLAAMDEAARPGKVIVAILTDGLENSSNFFERAEIARLIKQQTEVYNWTFIFLASELRAIEDAVALNIPASNTMNFDATREGTQASYRGMSAMVTNVRNDEPATS